MREGRYFSNQFDITNHELLSKLQKLNRQFDVQNTSQKTRPKNRFRRDLLQKICSFDTNSNIAMVNVSERTFRGTKNVQKQTQFTFCLQQNSSTQRGVVCFEQCLPQQSIQQRFRNGSLLATGLLARYSYNCTYIRHNLKYRID